MADGRTATEIGLALRRVLQAGREMQATLARRLQVRVTDVAAIDQVMSSQTPMGTVELGERLGMRSASAAVLVDRLVAAGHLVRSPHPSDRRRVTLTGTGHARHEVREHLAPVQADIAAIVTRLDDAQAATVLAFLQEAAVAMRAYAATPPQDSSS